MNNNSELDEYLHQDEISEIKNILWYYYYNDPVRYKQLVNRLRKEGFQDFSELLTDKSQKNLKKT